MAVFRTTLARRDSIDLTVPASDAPSKIRLEIWRDPRKRVSRLSIVHDGIDIMRPVDVSPPRRGESELDALDDDDPQLDRSVLPS